MVQLQDGPAGVQRRQLVVGSRRLCRQRPRALLLTVRERALGQEQACTARQQQRQRAQLSGGEQRVEALPPQVALQRRRCRRPVAPHAVHPQRLLQPALQLLLPRFAAEDGHISHLAQQQQQRGHHDHASRQAGPRNELLGLRGQAGTSGNVGARGTLRLFCSLPRLDSQL